MANTKRDFYAWVKVAYPGIWAEDMSTVDWTLPYYAAMIKKWESLGYPTAEGVTAVSPRDEPFISPPAEADTVTYVPGQVSYDKTTKKFFDLSTGLEITSAQAVQLLNQYNASMTPTSNIPQWRPGELEFEQQQFAFQREQFAWQKQQAQEDIARSYEDWRRRLLDELTDDEDWITRAMVEQTPEKYPWAPPAVGVGVDPLGELETLLDKQTAQVQTLQANLLQASLSQNWELADKIRNELTDAVRTRDTTYKDWTQMKTEGTNWSPQITRHPTIEEIVAQSVGGWTPPTPTWLPKFAPGQVIGKPITKEQIITPSGQQLTSLPPSQAARLSGFAKWSGGRTWKDVLAHAEIMQPFTPSGVGNRQWRPITQGVG